MSPFSYESLGVPVSAFDVWHVALHLFAPILSAAIRDNYIDCASRAPPPSSKAAAAAAAVTLLFLRCLMVQARGCFVLFRKTPDLLEVPPMGRASRGYFSKRVYVLFPVPDCHYLAREKEGMIHDAISTAGRLGV